MTTVTKSVVINAPREALRPHMIDPALRQAWNPNVYLWEQDDVWPQPGGESKIGFKAVGIDVEGVARSQEYDPETMNHKFTIEPDGGGQEPSTWHYSFDEQDDQTTVTAEVEYTIPGRILGPALDKLFVERGNAKLLQESLENLKAKVEGDE